jgi:RNA polymerase sigma factor (sigma-70 family)
MAEDLAQTALAKVFVSWRRISRKDAAQAYATRTLVNSYLAGRRRKHATEVLLSRLPDRPVPPPAPELRLVVLDALAALPPGSLAVVVLRHWEDLSIEQVADLLGCSAGCQARPARPGLDGDLTSRPSTSPIRATPGAGSPAW